MSSEKATGGPNRGLAVYLSNHHRQLDCLLDAGDEFRLSNVDVEYSTAKKGMQVGAIAQCDGYRSRKWRLTPVAEQRLEEYRETGRQHSDGTLVCPFCGCSGFSNLRNSGYQCKDPRCEQEFEEFAEVGKDV